MTAFSAAIDVIFQDANMAADAVYRSCNSVIDMPCRVILALPDVDTDYGSHGIVSETRRIDVRLAEIPVVTEGDRFTVNGEVLIVQGAPMRDRLGLVWKIEAVPEDRDDA